MWGTVVGALIIGVMNNGLDLLNVSPFYQQVVKGVIIIVAIIIDKHESGGTRPTDHFGSGTGVPCGAPVLGRRPCRPGFWKGDGHVSTCGSLPLRHSAGTTVAA